ncbi:hypothetical protein H072_567 [Dactylellina haptotyla CBS 200.50]|uniref:C-CAP/cofactor C-like domain-containing protein n=1 Tax=Dactylellina haptotyla (strain CBS 200.50) TaxID=1284197 RepID=S8ARE4_DACHA|nr:hypothetical protein H072_567 [Dactylellina haptotyla CBS 200.50]
MDEPEPEPKPEPQTPRDIFHSSFTLEIGALEERVLAFPAVRAQDRDSFIDKILSKIGALTHDLGDASNYLPAYDQRRLKSLADQFSTARKELAPRAKFSFKNRRAVASPSPAEATASSTSQPAAQQAQQTPVDTPPAGASKSFTSSIPADRVATLSSRQNARLHPPAPTPKTTILSLSSLTNCIVTSTPQTSATQFATLSITDITSSILLCGAIAGPAHITSLKNSILVLSCHQFRLHSSTNVDVYLRCRSRPIIEHCKGIRVAWLPERFANANSNEDSSGGADMWNQVDDFNWLKEGKPSPNWAVLEDTHRITDEVWEKVVDEESRIDGGLAEILPGRLE